MGSRTKGRLLCGAEWKPDPNDRWQPRRDGRGVARWESDLGTAYNKTPPPERDPLTAEEVQALPDGTRVIVLWGGGNGPHEYTWRNGRVCVDDKDAGTRPGGLIGSWGLVGNKPYQDKVWAAEGPHAADHSGRD